jgi:hypothetical protein
MNNGRVRHIPPSGTKATIAARDWRPRDRRLWPGAALLVSAAAALLPATAPARALPLPHAECERLDKERDRLEQSGVRADLMKGPAEAKSRLPADRLRSIAALIEIDEQLLFRCRGFRSLLTLKEDPPEPADTSETSGTGSETAKGGQNGPAEPQAKARPKAKPRPKREDAEPPPPAASRPNSG